MMKGELEAMAHGRFDESLQRMMMFHCFFLVYWRVCSNSPTRWGYHLPSHQTCGPPEVSELRRALLRTAKRTNSWMSITRFLIYFVVTNTLTNFAYTSYLPWWSPSPSHHPIIPSSHHPIIPSSHHPIIPSSHHPIIPSSHHPILSHLHMLRSILIRQQGEDFRQQTLHQFLQRAVQSRLQALLKASAGNHHGTWPWDGLHVLALTMEHGRFCPAVAMVNMRISPGKHHGSSYLVGYCTRPGIAEAATVRFP